MQVGPTARLLSLFAGAFFLVTGLQEWSAQSSGSSSWGDEASFIALQYRSQGKLKVGLGLGCFALASVGITTSKKDEDG
jgi:hypothetical protein